MNSENSEAPGLDPGLAAAAAAAGTAPAAPAPGAPAPADVPAAPAGDMAMWQDEARAMWALVGMQSLRWPSVGKVYTAEVVDRLAVAWAPVLKRHNITMEKYMIYFVAAGATMPILQKNVEAIREDRAAAAKEKAAGEGAPA